MAAFTAHHAVAVVDVQMVRSAAGRPRGSGLCNCHDPSLFIGRRRCQSRDIAGVFARLRSSASASASASACVSRPIFAERSAVGRRRQVRAPAELVSIRSQKEVESSRLARRAMENRAGSSFSSSTVGALNQKWREMSSRGLKKRNFQRSFIGTPRAVMLEEKPAPTKADTISRRKNVNGTATNSSMGVPEMSSQMKELFQQIDEDGNLTALMKGLRGTNTYDEFAPDVDLQLVEIDRGQAGDEDALPLVYDSDLIAAYWSKRPGAVTKRIGQLMSIGGRFLFQLLMDIATNKLKENELERVIELRNIVTGLGPAYIKLGQALSIRPDLLSPPAMMELQKLCDKVPSFPNEIALKMIEEELGAPWEEIFSELSPDPIAAASLGQVYKGRLKATGELVAVKVQRPYVLETVTIDVFIIRKLAVSLRNIPQIYQDLVGLVDEWALRFFEELDYIKEGLSGIRFAESMKLDLPQVVVPPTYMEYTSRRVLTTGWLEGEKLSQSSADDVGELVNIGVICYLKQLLDTGFFHADPHPGNLIRTPDGRLAVLDFGLMTQITDDQKYGIIEAMAHLIHRDYVAILDDFVMLGFLSPDVDYTPLLPVIERVFEQALGGGGAKSINFQDLAADLAQVTFDYPFRIPPYFAYIIRAIGVLEGIALVGDPNFAVVDEAYPYVAQRLLTDENPRLRAALRYTVYGKSNVFDVDRFVDILQAFENFTLIAGTGRGDAGPTGRFAEMANLSSYAGDGPTFLNGRSITAGSNALVTLVDGVSSSWVRALGPLGLVLPDPRGMAPMMLQSSPLVEVLPQGQQRTRIALGFLLSPQGEFFREFILDELVKSIDAVSRDRLAKLVSMFGMETVIFPFRLPGAVRPLTLSPNLTEEDRKVVDNVKKILEFFASGTPLEGRLARAQEVQAVIQVARDFLPFLPNVATQIVPEVMNRLVGRIMARFIRDNFLETAR